MEKDNKVTVISIILALIVIIILGFIIYYKTKPVEEKKEEKVPEVKEPIVVDNTDYEELSKELYQMLGDNPEFRYEEKVTFNTLSESVRDNIVINYLVDSCDEIVVMEKSRFLENYKKIFNHEKESDEGICELKDENYECTHYCSENALKIYKVFDKYEKTEDSIIIYENVGHLDYFDDGKIYLEERAGDSNNVIASFDSLDDLLNTGVTYKLPSYKHIFKKTNDAYYWESSELVKQ